MSFASAVFVFGDGTDKPSVDIAGEVITSLKLNTSAVLNLFGGVGKSQVFPSVVVADSVLVVHCQQLRYLLASHPEPSDAMRKPKPWFDADATVPILSETASRLAVAREKPRLRAVVNERPDFFEGPREGLGGAVH